MVNGSAPSELSGPLAQLWRSVYRKAASLAETRTGELLRDHVYLFHRRNLGVGEDTGPFVDEVGDTMSGTLHFFGEDVDAGGAIEITSPAGLESRLYGAGSAPSSPGTALPAGEEFGVRFSAPAPAYLVAISWYRTDDDYGAPTPVRLWDTTSSATPVATFAAPEGWDDLTLGWKEHLLPPGEHYALVPDRQYILSYTSTDNHQRGESGVPPLPDAGLDFITFTHHGAGGSYPSGGTTVSCSLDLTLRSTTASPHPAASGAIRLPNGEYGRIAWRNGADDGDDWLGVDADDTLLYNGSPLGGGGLATDPLADARGDLFAASAADAIGRLPVGTNGHVLTADSAEALGLKWAAGGGGGAYLPLAGGTLTGTLTAPVVVAGAGAAGAVSRLYGASSGAFTPSAQSGDYELGMRFTSTTATTLTEVRWYRTASGTATPSAVRLWDTTTSSAVWTASAGELTPLADTAVGWKTLTVGSPPALVASREYVLSYRTAGSYGQADGYTCTPDSPLVAGDDVFNLSPGGYPITTTGAATFLIDAGVSTPAAPPAAAGAIRLPNAAAVAWRNAGNSADLALTVSSGNALTFNGTPLGTGNTTLHTQTGTPTGATNSLWFNPSEAA